MLGVFAATGNEKAALEVIETGMPKVGMKPDPTIFTNFMGIFVKTKNKEQLKKVPELATKLGVASCIEIYRSLVNVFIDLKQVDEAQAIYKEHVAPSVHPIGKGKLIDLHSLTYGTAYLVVRNHIMDMEEKGEKTPLFHHCRGGLPLQK